MVVTPAYINFDLLFELHCIIKPVGKNIKDGNKKNNLLFKTQFLKLFCPPLKKILSFAIISDWYKLNEV